MIQLLREHSARSRFPWHFLLNVEPHGDMSEDLEDMRARDKEEAKPEGDYLAKYLEPESVLQENEEFRQLRKERYEILKREHFVQLRGEENVDAFLLDLPEEEPEKAIEEENEDAAPISPSAEDDGEGGVALAPPPPAPPETESLGEKLAFFLDVYEDCIVINKNWIESARRSLGETPVEWSPAEMER